MSKDKKFAKDIFNKIKDKFCKGTEITHENTVFISIDCDSCEKYLTMSFSEIDTKFGNNRLLIQRYSLQDVIATHGSYTNRPVFLLWATNNGINIKIKQYSVTNNYTLTKVIALIFNRLASRNC